MVHTAKETRQCHQQEEFPGEMQEEQGISQTHHKQYPKVNQEHGDFGWTHRRIYAPTTTGV